MPAKLRYDTVASTLHWLVAGLIATQFVLAEFAEYAADSDARMQQLRILANHKSVGITILGLAVLRLAWRMAAPPPALPRSMPSWQRTASVLSHSLIYVLLFALPISGWLMSSATAYSVSWFNLATLPDFVQPDKELAELFEATHEFMAELMGILVLVHIAAALKHHWIDKDEVLKRMSTVSGWIVFFAVAAGASAYLATNTPFAETAAATTGSSAAESATSVSAAAPAPLWNVDYDASEVTFTATQAGAPFTGRWQSWTATMTFDAAALSTSRFDVAFVTDSVDTRDDERDTALMDPAWFDGESHDTIRFTTLRIAPGESGYVADAVLMIKGLPHPVTFAFDVTANGNERELVGQARLDRLALNLGTGEWADTSTIGQFVDVDVRVSASVE